MENPKKQQDNLEGVVKKYYTIPDLPFPWDDLAVASLSLGTGSAIWLSSVPAVLTENYLLSIGYGAETANKYGFFTGVTSAALFMCLGLIGRNYCFKRGIKKLRSLKNKNN